MHLEYDNETTVVYVRHPQIQPYKVSWFGIGHIVQLINRNADFAERVREALQDPVGVFCNKCGYVGEDEPHETSDCPYSAVPVTDPCPDCDDGRVRCKADCIDRHPCPTCGGSGWLQGEAEHHNYEPCPACKNETASWMTCLLCGKRPDLTCPDCGGDGCAVGKPKCSVKGKGDRCSPCPSCGGSGTRAIDAEPDSDPRAWTEVMGDSITNPNPCPDCGGVFAATRILHYEHCPTHGGTRPTVTDEGILAAVALIRSVEPQDRLTLWAALGRDVAAAARARQEHRDG